MKIVFSAVDVKEMVQLFLEEHTSFEATNLDIAIIDEQIHVGIDEDLDTVVAEVQEAQLELDFEPAPKKRRGRKPKEVVVVESDDDDTPITTVEEKVEEVAEEVTTAVEETVADLDEQLVETADNLFDEPAPVEDEPAPVTNDLFDPSKPLFG